MFQRIPLGKSSAVGQWSSSSESRGAEQEVIGGNCMFYRRNGFFLFSRRNTRFVVFFWKNCLAVLSTKLIQLWRWRFSKLFKKKMEDLKVKSKRFFPWQYTVDPLTDFSAIYIKRLIGAAETIFKIPWGIFIMDVLVLFSSLILYVTHFS